MNDIRFITFEGGEGTGKTTIIEKLINEINELGYSVIKTREPGGSKIAEQIRQIILGIENTLMDYRTEALLYAASRRQHLVETVIPALKEGKVVLCDRYLDSSLAYQGYARGIGIDEVYNVNLFATDNLLPDLTIYIDQNPEVGFSRIKNNHRDMDRLDLEPILFHNKVREGYLEVAKRFPKRVVVVNGERTLEEVYQEIKNIIISKL